MKSKSPFILLLSLLFFSFSAIAQERTITEQELPQSIRSYIATHFKENKIVKIEEEKKGMAIEYEVKLDNAIELEFNSKNQVKEIKSRSGIKLPDSVIPPSILSYVKANYRQNSIVEWELKKKKQEIELENGIELEFDLNGKFLRIDD